MAKIRISVLIIIVKGAFLNFHIEIDIGGIGCGFHSNYTIITFTGISGCRCRNVVPHNIVLGWEIPLYLYGTVYGNGNGLNIAFVKTLCDRCSLGVYLGFGVSVIESYDWLEAFCIISYRNKECSLPVRYVTDIGQGLIHSCCICLIKVGSSIVAEFYITGKPVSGLVFDYELNLGSVDI